MVFQKAWCKHKEKAWRTRKLLCTPKTEGQGFTQPFQNSPNLSTSASGYINAAKQFLFLHSTRSHEMEFIIDNEVFESRNLTFRDPTETSCVEIKFFGLRLGQTFWLRARLCLAELRINPFMHTVVVPITNYNNRTKERTKKKQRRTKNKRTRNHGRQG